MKVNKKRLYKDVEKLTTIDPPRNYKNLKSLNEIADYIQEEFSRLNCKVENQKFKVFGKEYRNVIGSFGTDLNERVIVGAHYDVCGNQPGADDNASAVAGLLETARILSHKNPKLKNRIDFVAYSLEEPPFFGTFKMGSAIHAKYIFKNKIPVKGVICYEMIGYFSDEPNSQNFPYPELSKIYPNTGNFIIVVGLHGQESFTEKIRIDMRKNSNIDVQSINFPNNKGLAGLSDHRNYWKYGYNAVMINDTSFLRNPNYHEKTDTIDTLDFDKMVEVVKGCYAAIINL